MASFLENKTMFIERFPQFADPFAADWATSTATARSISPDYVSVSKQSGETEALMKLMENGRNCYQTLILYTQLAFPDNVAMLRIMGKSQYDSARTNQLKLPVLLKTAYSQASLPENKQALMMQGMKESEIESLLTLAESITNQEIVQQNAKQGRTLDANKRITALNLVWSKMSLVCQCAKLLFQNDALRYNLFLLSDSVTPAPIPVPTPAMMDKAQ
ncbi:MAG: hypothetical protein WCJ95_08210 [Mariniphaga sp.]